MIIDTNNFTDEDRAAVLITGLMRYSADIHKIARLNPRAIVPLYKEMENARTLLGHASSKVSPIEREQRNLEKLTREGKY